MSDFKVVGPFGIFKLDDILRATPIETSHLKVEISHAPQSHIEDFKFNLVQNTLIQVELIVLAYDAVETHERFTDTTNERTTRRFIPLDEDAALKFFGFDKESAPPRQGQEALTKERAQGINVRIWIKKHKDYLRKRAEFDEASSAMTAQPTDPNYAEEYGKVLKKQPSESETADFGTYVPRILNAMTEKLILMTKNDEDFVDSLESQWSEQDGNPTVEARKELLLEYKANMFSAD